MLNSTANVNIVLKACDLEGMTYMEALGSAEPEEETYLGTLVRRFVSKHQGLVGRRFNACRIW